MSRKPPPPKPFENWLHVKEPQDEALRRLNIVPGMAHFRDSGPRGEYCSRCRHFTAQARMETTVREDGRTGRTQRVLSTGVCAKSRPNRGGTFIPFEGSTPACKYFDTRDQS